MSERYVIFTLLMDKPPNGKLPVLSSFFRCAEEEEWPYRYFYDQT